MRDSLRRALGLIFPTQLNKFKNEMAEIKAFLRYLLGTNIIVLLNEALKYCNPKIGEFWFWETLILWSMWVGIKYLEERDEEKKSNGKSSNSSDSLLNS